MNISAWGENQERVSISTNNQINQKEPLASSPFAQRPLNRMGINGVCVWGGWGWLERQQSRGSINRAGEQSTELGVHD